MNPQRISPQGYNINDPPLNVNPFWDQGGGTGGNVPAGGTTGQVLTKRTDADYDTEWKTPESGGGGGDLPPGGVDGDLLSKYGTGAKWVTPDYATAADIAGVRATAEQAAEDASDAVDAVEAEETRAKAAESALETSIGVTSQEINDYKIANNQAVAEIRQDLSDEETAREDGDAQNAAATQAVASELSQYKQTNDAALTTIRGNVSSNSQMITDESNARIEADAAIRQDLTGAIQYETQQRESADTAIRAALADATGDISDQSALISSLDNRTTANENDIDALETSVGNLEDDVGDLAQEVQNISMPKLIMSDTERGGNSQNTTIYVSDSERRYVPVRKVAAGNDPSNDTFANAEIEKGAASVHSSRNSAGIGNDGAQSTYANILIGSNLLRNTDFGYLLPYKTLELGFTPTLIPGNIVGSNVRKFTGAGAQASALRGCLVAIDAATDKNSGIATDTVAGGTAGQALVKSSADDYDWEWADVAPADAGDRTKSTALRTKSAPVGVSATVYTIPGLIDFVPKGLYQPGDDMFNIVASGRLTSPGSSAAAQYMELGAYGTLYTLLEAHKNALCQFRRHPVYRIRFYNVDDFHPDTVYFEVSGTGVPRYLLSPFTWYRDAEDTDFTELYQIDITLTSATNSNLTMKGSAIVPGHEGKHAVFVDMMSDALISNTTYNYPVENGCELFVEVSSNEVKIQPQVFNEVTNALAILDTSLVSTDDLASWIISMNVTRIVGKDATT